MIIARVRTGLAAVPLRSPYALSFVTLESFPVRLVECTSDTGDTGLGEAVALPGYGSETDDDVARALCELAPRLVGLEAKDAIECARRDTAAGPFARSAVISAIEDAIEASPPSGSVEWPQVGILTAGDPAACVEKAASLDGFTTIKVKVGRDLESDTASARALLRDGPDARYRFDANQAYTEDEAARFLDALGDHPAVELVEQPLGIDQWAAFERLAARAGVPLMLDESILGETDIDRAASAGADLIKLKLCKVPGRHRLLELARRAADLGLGVVLGNGVSGEIGNIHEALVWASAPGLFAGAGEANGFAKLEAPMLDNPPRMRGGSMCWTPGPFRLSTPVRWDDEAR